MGRRRYLAFLGVQAIRSAIRGPTCRSTTASQAASRCRLGGWRQGFLSNITNPKVLIFYLAVLPQFLVPGAPIGWLLAFAWSHAVLSLIYLLALTWGLHRARLILARRKVRRAMDGRPGRCCSGSAPARGRARLTCEPATGSCGRLRAELGPLVDVSPRRRAEYSSDASNYRVVPRAVVFPRTVDDVLAAAAVCRELAAPLTVRGGGTSIAGNSVGPGVVLDLSRHLNKVIGMDPDARTAMVQPGVVLDQLQRAAQPHGLRFGPDPSTHSRCTIGGMIGNNSCGAHAMAYGTTAANVCPWTRWTAPAGGWVGEGGRAGAGGRAGWRAARFPGWTRSWPRSSSRSAGGVRPVPPPGVRLLARAPAGVG